MKDEPTGTHRRIQRPESTGHQFGVVALVPARNEEEGLLAGLDSLARQTQRPDLIVVVVNNSTDGTEKIAHEFAADESTPLTHVIVMDDNPHKKAGALNTGIDYLHHTTGLPLAQAARFLVVMDADTELHPSFLMRASRVLSKDEELGGVSAACRGRHIPPGSPWQRFLLGMQRIEYGRYAYTRIRRNVHTMSGAGSFYRTAALQGVVDWRGEVFWEDSRNLVEDYETTLALKEAGWKVTANQWCIAYTDLMPTLRDLVRQRQRWTRGAVDVLRSRGLTRHTWPSVVTITLELLLLLYGITWVFTLAPSALSRGIGIGWAPLAFWPLYWAFSVRHLGWRSMLVQLLIVPGVIFGLIHMYWQFTAVGQSYFACRRPAAWSE